MNVVNNSNITWAFLLKFMFIILMWLRYLMAFGEMIPIRPCSSKFGMSRSSR